MPTFRTARPLARLVAFTAVTVALAACKGLTSIDASLQNQSATDTVYAINGGPPGSPTAFRFFTGLPLRADQGFGFDLAFDIDRDGNVVMIPPRALAPSFATTSTAPYSVALQKVAGTYASVLEAPKDGYRADTAATVSLNQVIVAESRDYYGACVYSLKGQTFYSKLVVTQVDVALRRIIFSVTVNRNCGFRSFAPGIPQD